MKNSYIPVIVAIVLSPLFAQGQQCIDIPNMPISQINDNINDDVNYPVGSAYYSSGDIDLVKNPTSSNINHTQGDTIFCIGSGDGLFFSFANAPDPKTVTLNTQYEFGIVVDGDTVYQNNTPPASYTGSNFSYTATSMPSVHTITGSFDTVKVLNQGNLCISKVCVEQGGVAGVKEIFSSPEEDLLIFPNPVKQNQEISFKSSKNIDKILITDVSGKTIYTNNFSSNEVNLTLDQKYHSGIYFVAVLVDHKWLQKKIVVY